ncbi:MAG: 5-(carboxyamino)imidazole ribonucleotide synthase [Pasteurellaceae bacterium]|nr:5-(carboxyamino)imidazole ribonucleotide synthase [Pasteurellaceae bacterium]
MQKSALYPTIYVLGNGQLGRMLRYAGAPLDICVEPLAFDAPTFPIENNSLITAEIERWPETALTEQLSQHHNFINQKVFGLLADRLTQKQMLDLLGLATSPWQLLETPSEWQSLFKQLGDKVVVKRRTGGYDGRGQWIIQPQNTSQISDDLYQNVIAEKFIPFDYEISLVGARFRQGDTRFYPITHNLQQNGILRYSVVNPHSTQRQMLQQQAEAMLSKIMQYLDYVGVMAMECFVIGDKLLINELAPRVHNSGHWTQLGCTISQFELHLRALLDLPTPSLHLLSPTVMVNLIGCEPNPEWLNVPYSQLHWYGKAVREGRKLGHLNITHQNTNELQIILQNLNEFLPADYQSGLDWAKNQLIS